MNDPQQIFTKKNNVKRNCQDSKMFILLLFSNLNQLNDPRLEQLTQLLDELVSHSYGNL